MNKVPTTLYKYLSPERLAVLDTLQIRFTQPSALNDPFEFNLHFSDIVSAEEIRAEYKKMDVDELILQTFREMSPEQKVVLSSLPPDLVTKMIRDTLDSTVFSERLDKIHEIQIRPHTESLRAEIWNGLNRAIGILSLSADPVSPPMWANYGDNSQGIVVGFDTSSAFFDRRRSSRDEFYHLREVVYEDFLPASTLSEINPNILIHKSRSWHYEKEWRMLAPLADCDRSFTTELGDEVHLFSVPAHSVSEVIIGLKASEATVSSVLKLIRNSPSLSHVQIFQISKGPFGFTTCPCHVDSD